MKLNVVNQGFILMKKLEAKVLSFTSVFDFTYLHQKVLYKLHPHYSFVFGFISKILY